MKVKQYEFRDCTLGSPFVWGFDPLSGKFIKGKISHVNEVEYEAIDGRFYPGDELDWLPYPVKEEPEPKAYFVHYAANYDRPLRGILCHAQDGGLRYITTTWCDVTCPDCLALKPNSKPNLAEAKSESYLMGFRRGQEVREVVLHSLGWRSPEEVKDLMAKMFGDGQHRDCFTPAELKAHDRDVAKAALECAWKNAYIAKTAEQHLSELGLEE
jgi:hypothetical protein